MSKKSKLFAIATASLLAAALTSCSDDSSSSNSGSSSDDYSCDVKKGDNSVSLVISTPYFTRTETARVVDHGVEVTTGFTFPIRNPLSCVEVIEEELGSNVELVSCDKDGYSYRDYDMYDSDEEPPTYSRLVSSAKAECFEIDEYFDKIRRKSQGRTPEEYWGITADYEEGFYDYSLSSSSSSEDYEDYHSSSSEEIPEEPRDTTYVTELFRDFKPDFSKDYSCSYEVTDDTLMIVKGGSKNFNFVMTFHVTKDSTYYATQYYFPTAEIGADKCYDSQSQNHTSSIRVDKNECFDKGYAFYYRHASYRESKEEVEELGKDQCFDQQVYFDTEAGIYEELDGYKIIPFVDEDFDSGKFGEEFLDANGDGFALRASANYFISYTLDSPLRFGAIQFDYKPSAEEYKSIDKASIAFFGHSENELTIYYDKGSIYFHKDVDGEPISISAKATLTSDYNTITAQWGEGRMELYLNGELLTRQIVSNSKYAPKSGNRNILAIGRKETFDADVSDPMQAFGNFDNILMANARIIKSKETVLDLLNKYYDEKDY